MRQCLVCKSNKSTVHNNRGYECWYRNPLNNEEWFCKNCRSRVSHLMERKNWKLDYAIEWLVNNSQDVIDYRKRPKLGERQCLECKSKTTYIDKKGVEHWTFVKDEKDGTIKTYCENCYSRNIRNKSEYKRRWSKQRIMYKGKQIHLGYNPRTGICSKCGKKGYTQIHHEQYDDTDPLAHTQELCQSCHVKRTWELKQLTPEKFLKVNRKHNNN